MEALKGYRTLVFSILTLLGTLASVFGVVLPEGFVNEYGEAIVAAITAVYTVLRLITDGPVGEKVRELLDR